MTQPAAIDPVDDADERVNLGGLGRAAGWTALAVMSMLVAFAAARSDTGLRRINEALHRSDPPLVMAWTPRTAPAYPAVAELEAETRRLSRLVQTLSDDRDRVMARLASVERLASLERSPAVTGSIPGKRPEAPLPARRDDPAGPVVASVSMVPPKPADTFIAPLPLDALAPVPVAPIFSSPAEQKSTGVESATAPRHIAAAANPAAANSVVMQTQFAIELGIDPDVEAIRTRWNSIRNQHGALLDGLRPAVITREGRRRGAVEMHLIVGPLANAAAAARLCAVLGATGQPCQTTTFEGQLLAAR
ncbi:MAG: hypothetical protein J0H62_03835 [Rhizobiales bacterium]|nr:hypothetical protein [Hyphomicrobiales bacterium]